MKEAPFYIGQKIVRVKKSVSMARVGQEFICAGCFRCGGCGDWKVMITEYPASTMHDRCTCSVCSHNNGRRDYHVGRCIYFAPIEENHYEDVTKELAKLPQDEVPDVKQIKELI